MSDDGGRARPQAVGPRPSPSPSPRPSPSPSSLPGPPSGPVPSDAPGGPHAGPATDPGVRAGSPGDGGPAVDDPDLVDLLALPEDAPPLEQAVALEAVQERLARRLSGAAR